MTRCDQDKGCEFLSDTVLVVMAFSMQQECNYFLKFTLDAFSIRIDLI